MARVAEVQFHPSAVAEFDAAFDWYRQNSEPAAADFLREVNDAIASIAENPVRWAEHLHGTRRYVLRHFPYLVVYLLIKRNPSGNCGDCSRAAASGILG